MDLVAGGEGVEVFGFVEVPEHGRAVFAAGGAEGAVRADGHGVYVARVADVVCLDAAVGEFPDLWIGGYRVSSWLLKKSLSICGAVGQCVCVWARFHQNAGG